MHTEHTYYHRHVTQSPFSNMEDTYILMNIHKFTNKHFHTRNTRLHILMQTRHAYIYICILMKYALNLTLTFSHSWNTEHTVVHVKTHICQPTCPLRYPPHPGSSSIWPHLNLLSNTTANFLCTKHPIQAWTSKDCQGLPRIVKVTLEHTCRHGEGNISTARSRLKLGGE